MRWHSSEHNVIPRSKKPQAAAAAGAKLITMHINKNNPKPEQCLPGHAFITQNLNKWYHSKQDRAHWDEGGRWRVGVESQH